MLILNYIFQNPSFFFVAAQKSSQLTNSIGNVSVRPPLFSCFLDSILKPVEKGRREKQSQYLAAFRLARVTNCLSQYEKSGNVTKQEDYDESD
jgi:hypothetical protein